MDILLIILGMIVDAKLMDGIEPIEYPAPTVTILIIIVAGIVTVLVIAFSVFMTGVHYSKILEKQEGAILKTR